MKVWITRAVGEYDSDIDIFNQERKPERENDYWTGITHWGQIISNPPDFKKLFGFTPRKGSCKQYNLELKEIK